MLPYFKKLPLERQIFLSVSTASAILLLITLCLTLILDIRRQQESVDATILGTANYVANLESVADMLEKGYPVEEVTSQLELLRRSTPGLDSIGVYSRDGLRFYHTSRHEAGDSIIAGEEVPVLTGSAPYVTSSYGTYGRQHTAFQAVMGRDGMAIGFVTVSVLTSELSRSINDLIMIFFTILMACLMVALLIAHGIEYILVNALGGRKPHELMELYISQDNVLNALDDGLVSTDGEGVIVWVNRKARLIFGREEPELLGQPFSDIFPGTSCVQTAQTGKEKQKTSAQVGERQVLYSEIPLQGDGQIHGVLSIFHDKTELRTLSDELSGIRGMLDTMRFFNHEFMNKLHIILGYLQTGQTDAAIRFIMNSSLVSGQSIRETADCIRVSKLCALIIGKMMHAAELGVRLSLAKDSTCREEDLLIPVEECATIVGNLLENAIEELSRGQSEPKEITLSLYCRPDCNIITCEDTGGGIAPELLARIWEKGVSSKGEDRGFGLPLVRQLVEKNGGEIQLDTESGEGTLFTLTFTGTREEET